MARYKDRSRDQGLMMPIHLTVQWESGVRLEGRMAYNNGLQRNAFAYFAIG